MNDSFLKPRLWDSEKIHTSDLSPVSYKMAEKNPKEYSSMRVRKTTMKKLKFLAYQEGFSCREDYLDSLV